MKTKFVVVLALCFAVVCESASVSKQRRDSDVGGVTGWLAGLMLNERQIIHPEYHVAAEEKRLKTVRSDLLMK